MELDAAYAFDAPASQVWDLLMDPDTIAACLPGCRHLRPVGDNSFEADLAVGVAAISGSFRMTITLQEKNPPTSYRLVVDGTGRPGFVNGRALVALEPAGSRTTVRVSAQASVGGMLARVGQRLLEGVARMTMDRFYGCLASRLPPTSAAG
jgi:hypothetical protein